MEPARFSIHQRTFSFLFTNGIAPKDNLPYRSQMQPAVKRATIQPMSELTNQIERLQKRVEKTMVRL